jgi:hypothetical protein
VTTVGSLGVGTGLVPTIGFDITAAGAALATITTGTVFVNSTGLYTVNLQTGAATQIGLVGAGATALRGLAARRDQFSFAAATVTSAEGETATLTVNRDEASGAAVSVDYAIVPGSAAQADYTASNGTLTWAAGETAPKTISVPITDDTAEEGEETFSVALSNPSGGGTASVGAPSSAAVTIPASDLPPPAEPVPTLALGGKSKQRLGTVKRKGVALTATVDFTCDLSGSLKQGKRSVGRIRASLAPGKTKLNVEVAKGARKNLHRGTKLVAKATCSNVSGKSKSAKRVVTLKR